MSQSPRPLPRTWTLSEACQQIASADEWALQDLANALGRDALLQIWPDDFSECSGDAATIAYNDRPYADPAAVEKYIEARSLQRDLVVKALTWLETNYWIALARREQNASDENVSYVLLASLSLEIAAVDFYADGREYHSLRFRAPGADTIAQLVELVGKIALRMDPTFDVYEDFQREVEVVTGTSFPEATIKDAMRQAGVHHAYLKPGRRAGRPSKLNAKK